MRWIMFASLLFLAACLESPTGMVSEEGCARDEFFTVVDIGGVWQSCFSEEDIMLTVENGPKQDVDALQIEIQGSAGKTTVRDPTPFKKGFAATLHIPYDREEIASPHTIMITPIIDGLPCPENKVTASLWRCG
ncbi:MAG: hypothetical protein ABIH34_06490 [Nanoarchaeota archaeon]